MGDKVVAVIPARGGSKGVPRKNIKNLCGKPLIWYTIRAALSSGLIDRVIVSTEDNEIADISCQCGAEVPLLRPKEFAQDGSNLADGVWWTVDKLIESGYDPTILAVMLPVTPFRTRKMVDGVIQLALNESAISQTASNTQLRPSDFYILHNDKMVAMDILRKASLCDLYNEFTSIAATTITPKEARFDGNYHAWLKYVEERKRKGVPRFQNLRKFYLVSDPIVQLDINTLDEFELAELVLQKGLFKPDFN